MIHTVMDDTLVGARGIGRWCSRTCRACRFGLCGLAVLALAAQPVLGQSGSDGLSITVRESVKAHPRIVVPLNGSVIIETSKPIKRAQIVESTIAKVEAISAKQYVLMGVGYGNTQLMLWSGPDEREIVEIQVELDLDLLNAKLVDLDPQSNAEATSILGNIVLTGTVSGAQAAERMTELSALFIPPGTVNGVQNHLVVSGQQQVLMRVTVAEVSRSAMRKLGVDGFLAGDDFRDVFAVSQVGGFNPINIGAAGGVNAQNAIPFLTGEAGIPLLPSSTFSLGFPRVQMQLFIQALTENALLKVLAEPDLVAISGETASFLAGGEFPIPVPQSGSAAGSVTIEFREFGVRVNFTPVVLAHQKIRLRIAPEVSETDFSTAVQIQGFIVPGLTQRRMETTVEVGNGQTLAVAGLLSEEVRGISTRLPAVGDLPVIGALFRSVEYQRRQTELVFMVTPEIVAPLNPQQIGTAPGEKIIPPDDYELYALGLLESEVTAEDPSDPSGVYETTVPPRVAPVKSQPTELSLHGPWGYAQLSDL